MTTELLARLSVSVQVSKRASWMPFLISQVMNIVGEVEEE